MRPRHRALEGGLSGRAGAADGEQAEPVAEAFEQLRRGQAADACGGELDGERHAVELTAHLLDGGPVGREVEAGRDRCGASQEQLGPLVGGVERLDGVQVLAHRPEALARGREQACRRGTAAEGRGHGRGAGQHVLAVVQHDERGAGGGGRHDGGEQVAVRRLRHAERLGHRVHDLVGAGHLVELDQDHPPSMALVPRTRDGHREAGLADAAGAEQRHQRGGPERTEHHRDVLVAAEQVGDGGQVVEAVPSRRERWPAVAARPPGRRRRRAPAPPPLRSCSPGSIPSSSTSRSRARWYVVSASACRPVRASASTSAAHSPSRNGWASVSSTSEPIAAAGSSSARTASCCSVASSQRSCSPSTAGCRPTGSSPASGAPSQTRQRAVHVTVTDERHEARGVHGDVALQPVGGADGGDRLGTEGLAEP